MKKLIFTLICLTLIVSSFAQRKIDSTDIYEFYKALEKKDIGRVQEFLRKGINPNHRDSFYQYPVLQALGSKEILQLLFDNGASIENVDQYYLLERAIDYDDTTVVQLLLDKGADLNAKLPQYRYGLLCEAAATAPLYMFEFLERQGLKVSDVADHLLRTSISGQYNSAERTLYLIKKGAKTNGLTDYCPICDVASRYDTENFLAVLNNGGKNDINRKFENGYCALLSAMQNSAKDTIIELLLKNGADPNISFSNGANGLFVNQRATPTGATIKRLIKAGANINAQTDEGLTPLMRAIEVDNDEVFDTLIAAGADIHLKNKKGETVLSTAIKNNRLYLAFRLIDKGAENLSDYHINLMALLAMNNHDLELFKKLPISRINFTLSDRDSFPDINYGRGNTAIELAIRNDDIKALQYMLDNRVNLNTPKKSEERYTPLQSAVVMGKPKVVKFLLDKGVDINLPSGENRTALELSFRQRTPVFREITTTLLDRGANPDHLDSSGYSVLHFELYPEIVDRIITERSPINERAKDRLPIHSQARHYDTLAIKRLLHFGADINSLDNDYLTPLHYAVSYSDDNLKIVEFLLRNGADINAQDIHQRTVLHIAVNENLVELVELLLKNGADPNLKTEENYTALDIINEKEKAFNTLLKDPGMAFYKEELKEMKKDGVPQKDWNLMRDLLSKDYGPVAPSKKDSVLTNGEIVKRKWANGKSRIQATYTNGSVSKLITYYESGQLEKEGYYTPGSGVRYGKKNPYTGEEFTIYFYPYLDKVVENGTIREWYPNGKLRKEYTCVNGKHQGLERRWYENGDIASELNWENGIPTGTEKIYENGKVVRERDRSIGYGGKKTGSK